MSRQSVGQTVITLPRIPKKHFHHLPVWVYRFYVAVSIMVHVLVLIVLSSIFIDLFTEWTTPIDIIRQYVFGLKSR